MISAPDGVRLPCIFDGEKETCNRYTNPTTPLADGSHQLTYTLTDAAGNGAQSPAITVTVDTLAPAILLYRVVIWTMLDLIKEQGVRNSTDDTTPGVVISAPGAETPTLYGWSGSWKL
ncbi:Ig-like domain-containing protein [Acinetobacter baumannii]|uniref:Ig-like domain-containing protein n=1 Tax=Acinetobacter baumannii TaxID=470 RepID=UPI002ACAE3A1|nr:Ig-like domain-containing protein [Acinetobacter baumannii]MDZ5524897.1 Ig-like domain-containing protein [Acinetobacter baumannii]